MTSTAIYTRVSSKGQEDGSSLESQEASCRLYAAEHGFPSVTVYREVHTGIELWERPQLTLLREAIRQHAVNSLIVHSIDRLSRDPVYLGVILSEADHAGVPVHFVTEQLDDSPEGQLVRFVRGYAAKVEHLKIVERVNRTRRARAQAGKLINARAPLYGYAFNLDRSAYVINEQTAPIVRRIFRDAATGASLRSIAAALSAAGTATPSGGSVWRRSTLHTILHNERYTGRAVAYQWGALGKNAEGKKVTTRTRRPESEWIPLPDGVVPPLIDGDIFAAVAHRLTLNAQQASRNNRHPEAALLRGGTATCGYCSGTMHVETVTRGLRYVCGRGKERIGDCGTHAMLVQELDAIVWEQVSAILRNPALIAAKVAELRASDPTAADLEAVERQQAAVQRMQANFLDQIGNAPTPEVATLMLARVAAITEELNQLTVERHALVERRQVWDTEQAQVADLTAWCERIGARLETADYQMKRLALEYLDVRVKVYRRDAPERYVIEGLSVPSKEVIVSEPAGPAGSLTTKPRR